MKKRLLEALAIGGLIAWAGKSFVKARSEKPNHRGKPYQNINAYIEREMRRLRIPGIALAIVEGGEIVYERGFGQARPGGETPTMQTPFLIGSLTKSITALAVMQLVEAGKVELDSPVQQYLPWFRVGDLKASAQITVRHLLNHTSGLPTSAGDLELADFDDRLDATERQARALAALKLSHPVGSAVEYANMNYNLLGLIIEAASGESYVEYIQGHVLKPLGMHHTYSSRDKAKQNGLAMGHQHWFGFPFAAPELPIPHGSLPSGWLISTAADMARYLIVHLNGGRYADVQILSSAGIEALQRGVLDYRRMGVSAGKYAMGWFDGQIGQSRIVWHSGTVPDFGAFMALLPEQNKGLILLFNSCNWWYNPAQTEFGMGVTALLAGEQYQSTPYFAMVPWILRGQLLIPLFQAANIAVTLQILRRRQREPEQYPGSKSIWLNHLLLPLIPDLMIALTLVPVLGKRRAYLKLYMPDFSWIAKICGSFALLWSFLRTWLVLRELPGSSSTESGVERLETVKAG
jgi:CubicO group peptidase (beta-lactamase class C family)